MAPVQSWVFRVLECRTSHFPVRSGPTPIRCFPFQNNSKPRNTNITKHAHLSPPPTFETAATLFSLAGSGVEAGPSTCMSGHAVRRSNLDSQLHSDKRATSIVCSHWGSFITRYCTSLGHKIGSGMASVLV